MKFAAVLLYFAIPAAVYFTLRVGAQGFRLPDAQSLDWFAGNYLLLAAPQIVWGVIVLLARASARLSHGGFLALTAVLLAFHIRYECCADNRNGLGWIDWLMFGFLIVLCACGLLLAERQTSSPS